MNWIFTAIGALVVLVFVIAAVKMLIESYKENGVKGLLWGVVAAVLVGAALLGGKTLGYYE